MGKTVAVWLFSIVMCVLSGSALAQRAPCSGSHGGVVRCEGESFVCADGVISQSKKSCQASDYAGAAVVGEPEKSGYTIVTFVVGGFSVLVFAAAMLVLAWLKIAERRGWRIAKPLNWIVGMFVVVATTAVVRIVIGDALGVFWVAGGVVLLVSVAEWFLLRIYDKRQAERA